MELISDFLLAAGAFGAAIYCHALSRRLSNFATLESGMGGAIAVLSLQVDEMTRALEQARGAATGSASQLETLTTRAEAVQVRLELLLASMHDLPTPQPQMPEAELLDADRRLRFVRRRNVRAELGAAE